MWPLGSIIEEPERETYRTPSFRRALLIQSIIRSSTEMRKRSSAWR
jgi:hypothetical protein